MGSTSSRISWRTAGMVLLALYLVAGIAYSLILAPQVRYSDEREYLLLSEHLRNGPGYSMDGVHLTACRPPGYPFFVAGIQALGGGIAAIRIVQFLLLGATLWLVSRFCPKDGKAAALLAVTGLVILYPVDFYTAGTLYPQTLAGFLFVLALTLVLIEQRSIWVNLATGLVFSALILVVPTFGLTLLVVLAVGWLLKLINWRDAILILTGASILIGAWTARNAIQFHHFVPLASNSGMNFLIGNCENTIPYGGSGNVDRSHYEQEARARGLDEFETDAYYRESALKWIENNPGRAAVLYLEKAANFFAVYNAFAPENKNETGTWKQVVLGVSYALLLTLLAWRLWEVRRFPLLSWEKFFLLIYVLSAFTMAIFLTRIRFRLPYDFMIVAIIAGFLLRRMGATAARVKN